MTDPRTLIQSKRVLIAGGGGFIGGHLAARARAEGAESVRVADVKPLEGWYQVHDDMENVVLDLAEKDAATKATEGIDVVFQLAADMGGMGFIENNKALCMLSVLTNTHLLQAAQAQDVERFFYSSSACVYAAVHQTDPTVTALKESDAYPAEPEDGYGWEKLFSERMCRHFREDYGIETRASPGTTTSTDRRAPGPGGERRRRPRIRRKVAEAALSGARSIPVWGDGLQTRSFMYIDDCVEGTLRLTASDVSEPLNVGSSELVTINQLVDIVSDIAGVELEREHDLSAPQGVRGRNSDNTRIVQELGWEPSISLREGLEKTYAWVYDQVVTAR